MSVIINKKQGIIINTEHSHGGQRKGAGRPKTKEDTVVIRVPKSLVAAVKKLINKTMSKPIPKDKWKEESKVIPVTEYRQNYLSKSGKKNKYKAKKQSYGGVKYDSTLEAKVAEDLDWQLKAGDLVEVKRQVKIPLMVNGVLICTYYCDFRTVDKHGQVKYTEAKGMELPVWLIKKKLFLALLQQIDPGAEFEIVK